MAVVALLFVLLVLVFSTNTRIKLYAETNERQFIQLNSGYTIQNWLSINWYLFEDNEVTNFYDVIQNYGNYAYLSIQIPSDNPDITSLFLFFNTLYINNIGDYAYSNNGGTYLFEVAFYNGSLPNNNTINNYYFPYKVTYRQQDFLTNDYPSYLYYLDLTDTPISTEGEAYLIIRMNYYLFATLIDYNAFPILIPTDLDTAYYTRYWYDNGYSNGYDDGRESVYDDAYEQGYIQGFYDGKLVAPVDYGIHDLLFAIFDTPFEVMQNLFSMTLFTIPVWTIITSLTLLMVVLWIIKRFLT